MDSLQWDLRQTCLRNRDGSRATQSTRERTLDMCARQLKEMGFRQMRAQSLKPKHVEALVAKWQADGISAGTLKNRMAHLRWWAEKIGKPSVIPNDNARLGIPDRPLPPNEGKQMALDIDKLVTISDEWVRLSLLLQSEFGLRREESIKFRPDCAIRGDTLFIKKGRVARTVPIRNADQRWVLEKVRETAGKDSLIPPERSYVEHLGVYERELRKAGISCARRLRHHYAQRRYEELTGWKAPHAGGPGQKDLTDGQKAADHQARLTIGAELGVAHEQNSVIYFGR